MSKLLYKITYFSTLMIIGTLCHCGLAALFGKQISIIEALTLSGAFAAAFCYTLDFGERISVFMPR